MDHDDGVEGMTVARTGVVRPTGLLHRTKQYLGGVPAHVQAQIHKDKTTCSVMVRGIVSKGFVQRLICSRAVGRAFCCRLDLHHVPGGRCHVQYPLQANVAGAFPATAALAALSVGDLARNNMCGCWSQRSDSGVQGEGEAEALEHRTWSTYSRRFHESRPSKSKP